MSAEGPTPPDASPITTIVADFGGVLSTPLAPAFAAVQRELALPPEALGSAMAAVAAARGAHPLHELETGAVTERAFFAGLERALTAQLRRPVALDAFSALYWDALQPNAALIEHLIERGRQGYRMGLLTNNVREWEPRWRAMLPAELRFDAVVDSAQVGMRKPDAAIYALTAHGLGVPGGEIVLIDDFASNCEGARAAGWAAVRFEATEQAIDELDALLERRGAPRASAAGPPGSDEAP